MYTVYILQSQKDHRTYIGYTNEFDRRLLEHNAGRVKSTKHRAPFKVLFLEQFNDSQKAKKRETYWKSGAGRRKLNVIFNFFKVPIRK